MIAIPRRLLPAKGQAVPLAGLVLLVTLIYLSALHVLGQKLELHFVGVLLLVGCMHAAFYGNAGPSAVGTPASHTAWALMAYTLLYMASIYQVNALGSSVALWFVQFAIPLAILKVCKEPLANFGFQWRLAFMDLRYILAAALVLVPYLVFNARDSAQIIALFQTQKIAIYLPLSLFSMLVIAAFWEEFFFRGIVLHSLLKLTGHAAGSVVSSALLFAIYHVPMRYLNPKSPYHGDLALSICATLGEQFLMGLLLGSVVIASRNVWHAIWLHTILNGVSFIYRLSTFLVI